MPLESDPRRDGASDPESNLTEERLQLDLRLGQVLLREGLVSEVQLREALRTQRTLGHYVPLGQLLVERKLLTQRQLNLLLDEHDKRPRLGEVLVRGGVITEQQLQYGLDQQKKMHAPLGEVLVKLNYVTDESMRQALCVQLNIPFVDSERLTIDPKLARVINRTYARHNGVVPVSLMGQSLTVAIDDPTNRRVVEELEQSTGYVVSVVTSSHDAIQRGFARLYAEPAQAGAGPTSEVVDLITEEETPSNLPKSRYLDQTVKDGKADSTVRQLLNIGIGRGCSDIHLEPLGPGLHIRFRLDGVLTELELGGLQETCDRSRNEIVSRVKVLGKLDIAERRRPQDGSFRVKVERQGVSENIDFRLSVVPGYYGESVVLRVLDKKNAPKSIAQLGFSSFLADKLQQLLTRPTGILLVTGPTGCGKSSTLYALLMTAYRPQIRILTAEDPIEYVYDQFSQSEVNERIGNTFANYLRAFLRHDPEVIMVGEIRDEETAEMAFRAAQTGHLLLSTLHTNDAVASVMRLRDLNVDPNLIASSLLGVLSQRLIRQICSECKTVYAPPEELLQEFFTTPPTRRWHKGMGCPRCNFTGYKGRLAVGELWMPNEQDVVLISKNASIEAIRASAEKSVISIAQSGVEFVQAGQTTFEELIRMLPYDSIYRFRRRQDAGNGAAQGAGGN